MAANNVARTSHGTVLSGLCFQVCEKYEKLIDYLGVPLPHHLNL